MVKLGLNKYSLKKRQLIGLFLFVLIGLLHQFIANDSYLICTQGEGLILVSKEKCTKGLPALIPYSTTSIDKDNRNVSPFAKQDVPSLYYRHWLGTDAIGRDVLAGVINGFRIALMIGFFAILLTALIGIFFGYLSGYIGNHGLKLSRTAFVIGLMVLSLSLFYFINGSSLIKFLAIVIAFVTCILLVVHSNKKQQHENDISIPFDLLVMKFIEIIRSMPRLFLVLVLIGLFKRPSFLNVILIIALIRWPSVTRYLRAEILKVKEEGHVLAAKALGLSKTKIFTDHILPLSISPVIIACAFGFSAAILLESTLSFLGIGIPLDQMTWGSILNGARASMSSWWLAFFPGMMIYLTVLLFNSLGDSLSEYFRKGRE